MNSIKKSKSFMFLLYSSKKGISSQLSFLKSIEGKQRCQRNTLCFDY